MNSIRDQISVDVAKQIFSLDNAKKVLHKLDLYPKKNFIYETIVSNWDYIEFKQVVRKVALSKDEKYDIFELPNLLTKRDNLILSYKKRFPEDKMLDWVFNPDAWDNFRKKETFGQISEEELINGVLKHKIVAGISDLTSRITELIMVKDNEGVFPTLKNSKGVDYFYDGEPRDWKNSKSVGGDFKNKCSKLGLDYVAEALKNPQLVIKSLYENQTEIRFGSDPRHFIVNLHGSILTNDELIKSLKSVDFEKIYPIEFVKGGKTYSTVGLITYI